MGTRKTTTMKRPAPSQFALLAALCLTVAACDEESTVDGEFSADLHDDDADDAQPTQYTSVYPPFDPDDADEQTLAVADAVVEIKSADGQPMPEDARQEAEEIQTRFAHALVVAKGAPYFTARSAEAEKIEITYLGRGTLAPPDEDGTDDRLDSDASPAVEIPEKYLDGGSWMTGFSPATGSEFEVRFPAELAEIIGLDGEARGANRGTPVEGMPEVSARSIVGPDDTRVRKGAVDTRLNSSTLRRIVDLSGCTGALVGPHHVITAAHCIYGGSGWASQTLRVGRNGNDWYGSAVSITGGPSGSGNVRTSGGKLYWISSAYKSARDMGSSPKEYDIGIIITPNDDLGAQTGWFGWVYSNSSHDDMLNRGYPSCSTANNNQPPGGPQAVFEDDCLPNHMYGDANYCGTGGFSSAVDSYGLSLYGYHSCDTSGAHSGSPLYRLTNDGHWVVRGVHKGALRDGVDNSSNDIARQSFALITHSRSDLINTYRSAYP